MNGSVEKKKKNLKFVEEIREDGVFSNLPIDVLFDILSRLPIKTISESARWVSKTWYNICVHNPRFAQLHYAKSLQTRSMSAFFRCWDEHFHLIDHQLLDNFETTVLAYSVEFTGFKENCSLHHCFGNVYEIVGSVNGLICFASVFDDFYSLDSYSLDSYYICNPVTRDYLVLPKSPNIHRAHIASGFGFDSISNDYKVIRVLSSFSKSNEECFSENLIEVYTLGSESWRVISTNLPYISSMLAPSTVLVNGCLHWLSYKNTDSSCSRIVVSFNVATEEFDLFELPPHLRPSGFGTDECLMLLGDCLGLSVGPLFGHKNIWVMKDYGVQDSWAKAGTVESEDDNWIQDASYEVIELKNGELLLVINHKLGYYDLRNRTFKPIKILRNERVVNMERPIFLVASLFSPSNVGNRKTWNR